MENSLNSFIQKIEHFDTLSLSEKCDYFMFYLTEIKGKENITAKDIGKCFEELRIAKHSNISAYLNSKSKKNKNNSQLFIKNREGFHLERSRNEEIKSIVSSSSAQVIVNDNLRNLLPKLKSEQNKVFLDEAIKSFEVSAYRASIIMVWLLTIDVIYEYIIDNKLSDFNIALSKVTDKRVKTNIITKKDDFSDIPENKFIEICRSSRIISNDIRKILDVKLGIRNSAAHPSTISFGEGKTYEFIEDLTNNVILKFI
jgi:hypothetical protein